MLFGWFGFSAFSQAFFTGGCAAGVLPMSGVQGSLMSVGWRGGESVLVVSSVAFFGFGRLGRRVFP